MNVHAENSVFKQANFFTECYVNATKEKDVSHDQGLKAALVDARQFIR